MWLLTPGLAVVFARTPGELADAEEDNAPDLPYFSPPTPPRKWQPVRIPEANAHDNNNVAMSIGVIFDAEVDAGDDEESETSENFGYMESGVTGPDSDGEDPFSSSDEEDLDREDQKPEGSPDPGAAAKVEGVQIPI